MKLDQLTLNGKKYQKMYQNMFGHKDSMGKDGSIIRKVYAKLLNIVDYDKTYIIEGELFAEVDEFSEDNLV